MHSVSYHFSVAALGPGILGVSPRPRPTIDMAGRILSVFVLAALIFGTAGMPTGERSEVAPKSYIGSPVSPGPIAPPPDHCKRGADSSSGGQNDFGRSDEGSSSSGPLVVPPRSYLAQCVSERKIVAFGS